MTREDRFTKCWTKAHGIVSGYVHSLVRNHAAAEDVVQNVALTLLRRFDEYDEEQPFEAWALGVAKWTVLSLHRDSARSPIVMLEPDLLDSFTEEYAAIAPELEHRETALQECIQQLQGRPRQVLEMRYFEELKPREVAERLGIEPNAVRVMLSRLRSLLKECIERRLKCILFPL